MPSPFPGMDPFLEDERLWPDFHHQLLACLYQVLLPGLVDRYRARIGLRTYTPEADPSGTAAPGSRAEEFIEVRDRSEGRLVTLIDVVSPANKTTAAGRPAYLAARQDALARGAGVVEIDLVRRGEPTLTYSREGLPAYDYSVTVVRPAKADRYEIYTATLAKRLPKFKVPLAPDDRDTVVDLQAAFTRAYELGNFAARIDYPGEPGEPGTVEHRAWLDRVLAGVAPRGGAAPAAATSAPGPGSEPPADEVAVAAYFLWLSEGCPHGRDKDHWYRAVEQLREGRRGSTPA